nr:hypothetical protein [Tanacetum cinerariifolium]
IYETFWLACDILNTLDPLGKFDGKADEGFLVGYYVSRSGPIWLFDIDTLTQSMNCQPVLIGNHSNSSAGIQEHFDAGKAGKGNVQQYVLLLLWSTGSKDPQNTDADATFEVKEPNTNSFSAADPFNTAVSPTFSIDGKSSFVDPSQYPDDPNMPALEYITYLDNEEDVGAEADFSNLETSITVSPILTFRVHKDHHVTQIIGDLSSAPQTRSITKMVKDQEEVYVYQPPRFGDPDYPDKVYVDDIIFGSTNKELCKAFEKLMKDKFQMSSIDGKSAGTPIDTEKPLLKDPDDGNVDVHTYRSMIGSLMYLTSSRPDIMFSVCACVHFQVTPKALHLHAVKRIFRQIINAVSSKLMLFGLTIDVVHLMLLVKKTNDAVRLQALIDRKKVIITLDSIRQALRLDDAGSVDCLPNEDIFAELARMRTIGKGFSGVDTPLFDGMLVPQQAPNVEDAVEDENDENVVSVEPTPPSSTPTIPSSSPT